MKVIHVKQLNKKQLKDLELKLKKNADNQIIIEDYIEKLYTLKNFYIITKQYKKSEMVQDEICKQWDLLDFDC